MLLATAICCLRPAPATGADAAAAAIAIPLGATRCITCTMGKYSDEPAQATCKLCPPGYFSSGGNASLQCQGCPYGSYSDAYGSTGCTLCPAGKTTVNNPLGTLSHGQLQSLHGCVMLTRAGMICRSCSFHPGMHVRQ